jgi:tetratricopeptide (TPR) repeat protein
MQAHFEKYYQQGLQYLKLGDYHEASEAFKKAVNYNKNSAEAWQYVGYALSKLNRNAEAGMFLRKALDEYDRRLESNAPKADNYYGKASVLAMLFDKQPALETLHKAVQIEPIYAEKAVQQNFFGFFETDADFLKTIQSPLHILASMRFRGNPLCKSELNLAQLHFRQIFLEKMFHGGWKIQDFSTAFENNEPIFPQAQASYVNPQNLSIKLSYYLDEHLVFMELENGLDDEDLQAYRLYKKDKIEELLEVIIAFQEKIDSINWDDFIGELIDVCDSVSFEMPDGRKVKVS